MNGINSDNDDDDATKIQRSGNANIKNLDKRGAIKRCKQAFSVSKSNVAQWRELGCGDFAQGLDQSV